jgi:hypothetical protein
VIRFLGLLLIAGVLLSACGSVSASTAMSNWTSKSSFSATSLTLRVDAAHSTKALNDPTETALVLHTVCSVMGVDVLSANNDLPTPDSQATTLLSKAYGNLGAGALECYRASTTVALREKALSLISLGASQLAEGRARVASVKAS